MRIEQQFWSAYQDATAEGGSDDLVPSRLASAAASVLPVDGASISFVHGDLRVPLGADSEVSSLAERLQFTVGDGPCMQAGIHDIVIDAPQLFLRSRWPLLADEWERNTPYRSATSIPIPLPRPTRAALNLFFTRPNSTGLRPIDASLVAALIGSELVMSSPPGEVEDLLRVPRAGDRLRVWLAVGILMRAQELVASDALDALRARAYAAGASVDALAAELVRDPSQVEGFAP